jgi:hypothetical protein
MSNESKSPTFRAAHLADPPPDPPGVLFKRADLEACIDATLPDCPDCFGLGMMVALETTAGNWQLLCLQCLGRWGTTWRPADKEH